MDSPVDNRIGTVFVPVSDMDRAIEWYDGLFGLPSGEPTHEGTIYGVETAGDADLLLDANGPVENSSQPLCFFPTDDLAATYEFLRERGIPIVHEPEDIGSVTILTFEDPDGNRLMVCERN